MIMSAMNNSSSVSRSKYPAWLTSVLIVLGVIALVWTLGVTVFRDALEERGLPEEIRGSSAEQFALWQYGTRLADLAGRAEALSQHAHEQSAEQLQALHESLANGAALLGEVRTASTGQVSPSPESDEATKALANEVLALNEQPVAAQLDGEAASLIVRVAFATSLEARAVILAEDPQTDELEFTIPSSASPQDAADPTMGAAPLSCLSNPALLEPGQPMSAEVDTAPVRAARALDRGYALDYVLQLQAARGDSEAATSIEAERRDLNDRLAAIRTVFAEDCSDLRQLAYDLPEGSLDNLAQLSAQLERDFVNELLSATALTSAEARSTLASTVWQMLATQPADSPARDLLATE